MLQYKFMAPPSKIMSDIFRKSDEPETEIIDENDPKFIEVLNNFHQEFLNHNIDGYFIYMNLLINFLENKTIPSDFPLFNLYQICEHLINSCQTFNGNPDFLDLTFHLIYVLTQNPFYCERFPISIIVTFLMNPLVYSSCQWFFRILSNYINESSACDFPPNLLASILGMIQIHCATEKQRLCISQFIEKLSEFNISPDSSVLILHIINILTPSYKESTKENLLVISISRTLLNLARNRCLHIETFNNLHLTDFITKRFEKYPDMAELLGYLSYHYHMNAVPITIFACHSFDEDKIIDNAEIYIWAMYNSILINKGQLLEEGLGINIGPFICKYLAQMINNFSYVVQRQSILLISLICSLIPLDEFEEHGAPFPNVLELFMRFSEDGDDKELLYNILQALENMYKYFSTLHLRKDNPTIITFNMCKDMLSETCSTANQWEIVEVIKKFIL
ncbi:hypothetical protein TRFO_21308 [Tritrichomonas foetus]|uniref:SPIN90/Ldb17 leucine-rich domain-containing protein n=1 Tax=Tritrichomonas foetus TaxID=1144522 RepID=A0A1J4KF92_9EUKA|nr:hypothetical protein TRFO_21308 [Tritrichomonas foetus]|eukprot:OHT09690.1 hypothetical protein TRFO_21308 [Tritrichomonas foetus]